MRDYAPGNLADDFAFFPGYHQARGHFLGFSSASFSDIFFILDDVGDSIFANGFELFNRAARSRLAHPSMQNRRA